MFHFVNTITESEPQIFEPEEFDKWEGSIIMDAIKEDASVVEFYTLQRPLGESRVLKPVRNISFGKNLKLQHQYFVVRLKKKDETECFLSLDKAPNGITAQYGLTYYSVANKFKGDYRYKPLPKLQRSFNPFKFVILPNVSAVLGNLEGIVNYDLWDCNCQKLTQKLADLLTKQTDKIKLHVPGTDKKVGVNDESLLCFVESIYPEWKKTNEGGFYELTRIPNVGETTIYCDEPGMIATVVDTKGVLRVDPAKQSDYVSLVDRQKFYNRVCNNEKVMGTKGLLKNERHVIMRNLKPNKYTKVMEELNKEATVENNKSKMYAIEMVSSIWNHVFDILVITEKHGLVLFQFAEKDDKKTKKKDDKNAIELKAEMLQKLGDFGESKFLTTVLVVMHVSKNKHPKFKRRSYGCHFDLTFSTLKREDGEFVSGDTIDERVTTIFTKIRKDIPDSIKKKELEKKLNMLVGNIYLLQNLEDDHHLLHHKVTSQEWGRPDVMLWTPKQWECIEMAKNAFRQESSEKNYFRQESREKLKLLVKGCQGSGKTLLLMRIAREFVATNKDKKVWIFIQSKYKMLIEQLSDIIASDTSLCSRIIIDSIDMYGGLYDYGKLFRAANDIGLVLEDEAEHNDLRDTATLFHSVIFTSFNFRLRGYLMIELDGNLRSSTSICNKTNEIYLAVCKIGLYKPVAIERTIKIRAKFKSVSPFEATVCNFQDRSKNRQELKKNLLKIFDDTRQEVGEKEKIVVSFVCFPALRKKIQSEWKTSDVNFHSPDEMLGCQFSNVILVWEPSALSGRDSLVTIINVMTRCTTNLTIVINNTLFETIHGMPSIARPDMDTASFTKYLKEIDVKFEKILVIYQDEIDPMKIQLEYKQLGYEKATITFLKKIQRRSNQAEHVRDFIRVIDESHKFNSQVRDYGNERWLEDELRRFASEYQLVVYVVDYVAGYRPFPSFPYNRYISCYSPVPVLQLFTSPSKRTHPMMTRINLMKSKIKKLEEIM